MTTLTIHLDDLVAERVRQRAETEGTSVDKVVNDVLSQQLGNPAQGLIAFIEKARREGWKSDRTGYLTDDEMYTR